MAIVLTSGIVPKNVKGKVGDVVFARLNKETTVRAYQPKVRNPRTLAQVRQRRKFTALQHGISRLYASSFKPYGIKLNGHSAYTSISRMIHNNLVVKSVGYPKSYLPEIPKNYQRLLAYNTNLDGELFKYIAIRVIKQNNNTSVYLGCSVPKAEHPEITLNMTGVKYFGSNIAFTSMISYISCMGTRNTKMDLFENDVTLAINESGVGGNTIIGATADDISMNYKYVYKSNVVTMQDPQIADNVFIVFGTTERPLSIFGASSFDDIEVDDCAWPGVTRSGKSGFTIFTISIGTDSQNLGDVTWEEQTSVYHRYCISAVNDWSEEYTIGA